MRKYFSILGMAAFAVFAVLLVGCQGIDQFSPEQVMQNALKTENDDLSYSGEQTVIISDPDDTFTMEVKEWRSGDKSLETVKADNEIMTTLMDGEKISIYDETENTVTHTEFDNMDELHFNNQDQVEEILNVVGDTHDIENKGEETIADRPAIHLIAEKRSGEKSLYGTYEMWIDKENWIVLKTKSETGDAKTTMEYTTITFESNMDDEVFELDVPEDATVKTLEDDIEESEDITLKESVEKLGRSYVYIPEEDDITIDSISYMEIKDEISLKSIDVEYHKDGLPFLVLSIHLTENNGEIDATERGEDDLTEHVSVRGVDAEFFEEEDIRLLSWTEDELEYSLSIIHPNYPLDEVISLVESMEKTKK